MKHQAVTHQEMEALWARVVKPSLRLRPSVKSVGRPLKHRALITDLEDNTLYSPGLIARGAGMGTAALRLNARHTLSGFARRHGFHPHGDGLVRSPGQAPTPGWYGWRWKLALGIYEIAQEHEAQPVDGPEDAADSASVLERGMVNAETRPHPSLVGKPILEAP